MKRTLGIVLAAAVVISTGLLADGGQAGQAGGAPQTPRRGWWSVNVVTIKRGSDAAWRDFTKTQTLPMQQKGGVRQRDTWQSGAPFGDGSTYAIVTPIDKFEDYDKPPLAARMLTGEPLRAYLEKNASLTVSNHMFAVQDRTELSIAPASMAKIRAAVLTRRGHSSGSRRSLRGVHEE